MKKILLGNQIFGRIDLIYVISYQAVVLLIESLVLPRLDHSRIDWVSIFQRFVPMAQLRSNLVIDEVVIGSRLAGRGIEIDRCLPSLAFVGFLYIVVDIFSFIYWLEKFLRSIRIRGERYKYRRRKKWICGIIFIILVCRQFFVGKYF